MIKRDHVEVCQSPADNLSSDFEGDGFVARFLDRISAGREGVVFPRFCLCKSWTTNKKNMAGFTEQILLEKLCL